MNVDLKLLNKKFYEHFNALMKLCSTEHSDKCRAKIKEMDAILIQILNYKERRYKKEIPAYLRLVK